MFDQPIIRVCLVLGSLITATYILRRVRLAKVQIEDTIFWLLFSGILLILAIFPGIAFLFGGQYLQVHNIGVMHRTIVNIVAAAHQRAALIGQTGGKSHLLQPSFAVVVSEKPKI